MQPAGQSKACISDIKDISAYHNIYIDNMPVFYFNTGACDRLRSVSAHSEHIVISPACLKAGIVRFKAIGLAVYANDNEPFVRSAVRRNSCLKPPFGVSHGCQLKFLLFRGNAVEQYGDSRFHIVYSIILNGYGQYGSARCWNIITARRGGKA